MCWRDWTSTSDCSPVTLSKSTPAPSTGTSDSCRGYGIAGSPWSYLRRGCPSDGNWPSTAMGLAGEPRATQLDELYSLLDAAANRCGGPRTLAECHGRMEWPRRGVYFFFEPGEHRENLSTPRVVRVGTHGLRPSSSTTLWGRLSQHRGNSGGGHAGGGNHRGSIFRLHVGEALLASGDYPPEISRTWGRGSSAPLEVRTAEYPLERDVSTYIRAMPFLWVEVDDDAESGQ